MNTCARCGNEEAVLHPIVVGCSVYRVCVECFMEIAEGQADVENELSDPEPLDPEGRHYQAQYAYACGYID